MITTTTIEDLVDRLELAVGKCREAGIDLGRFWEQKTDELIYLTRRDISARDYGIDGLYTESDVIAAVRSRCNTCADDIDDW